MHWSPPNFFVLMLQHRYLFSYADIVNSRHVLGGIVADCPFWTLCRLRQVSALVDRMQKRMLVLEREWRVHAVCHA
jgi:hypothetical protein